MTAPVGANKTISLRRREERYLRRMEELEADFDAAKGVEAELRINKQINHVAKMASKAVRRRLRWEDRLNSGKGGAS